MHRNTVRLVVVSTVLLASVLGGVSSAVAVEEDCNDGCLEEPGNDPPELNAPASSEDLPAMDNEVAATRVRKAFLQAKKAFHEARQEIQAIKKGEESARENVPTFFEDDDESQ